MLQNYENALENISKAIKINPKESKYYYTRGRLYFNQGKMKEALSDFNKALELNPKNSYAYYELYRLYENTPEMQNAAKNLSMFIRTITDPVFKGLVYEPACMNLVMGKNIEVDGCKSKSEYLQAGITLKTFEGKKEKKVHSISNNCCEYECETYTTQCCENYECTDYDYYTGECTTWKCNKLVKCNKEKCKCIKICEE